MPHQVSEAVAPAPPPPGIAAVASRGTALGSTGPDVDAGGPYPEVNPDVAVVSTLPRPDSVLADTAHAPKKMINSNVTTIAPTDVSMAKLRLAYDTIAHILYSSTRPIDSLPTTLTPTHPAHPEPVEERPAIATCAPHPRPPRPKNPVHPVHRCKTAGPPLPSKYLTGVCMDTVDLAGKSLFGAKWTG